MDEDGSPSAEAGDLSVWRSFRRETGARFFLASATAAFAACVLLASASTATSAEQEAPTVAAVNIAFDPPTLTASSGTTVTWTNQDPVQHTVTADDGAFDSGLLGQDEVFSRTFDTPGAYAYYCVPHGAAGGIGMAGVILIVEAQ